MNFRPLANIPSRIQEDYYVSNARAVFKEFFGNLPNWGEAPSPYASPSSQAQLANKLVPAFRMIRELFGNVSEMAKY